MGKLFKTLFFLYLVGTPLISSFAQYAVSHKETEIFSNGDYGLDLDWVKTYKGNEHASLGGQATIMDSLGNAYFFGAYHHFMEFPDGTRIENPHDYLGYFFAKMNRDGDLLWVSNVTQIACSGIMVNHLYISPKGYLLADADTWTGSIGPDCPDSVAFEYNNKPFVQHPTGMLFKHLLKIDLETGDLLDMETCDISLDKTKYPYGLGVEYCLMDDKGNIFLMLFIGDDFKGLNQNRLKSDTRCHGGADAYIAKIDPDFNLVWDFALGGDGYDIYNVPATYYDFLYGIPYPYDEEYPNYMLIHKDTMIIKSAVFSESMDIDFRPEHEVLLSATGGLNDAFVAKYLLKEDGYPELINYKFGWSKELPHYLYYREDGHLYGMNMGEKSEHRFLMTYKDVDGDFNCYSQEGYQYNLSTVSTAFWSFPDYYYDKKGNFYVNLMKPYGKGNRLSLEFAEGISLYYEQDTAHSSVLAKYDADNQFRWALAMQNSPFDGIGSCTFDDFGGVYLATTNTLGLSHANKQEIHLDLDPSETGYFDTYPYKCLYMKYIETFRIKSAPVDHGEIQVPDSLIRWGSTAEIKVIPHEGYELESVFTDQGELLTKNSAGLYEVKNVQDVVTISATFNESSSVEDLSSSAQRIYPNPVKDCLYIENGESCTEVELLSADGKVLRREKGCKKLSLEGLHSGIYTLRLKNRDNVYINKIIKK